MNREKVHQVIEHLANSAEWMATPEGQEAEGFDPEACLFVEQLLKQYGSTLWNLPEGEKPPTIESIVVSGDFKVKQ